MNIFSMSFCVFLCLSLSLPPFLHLFNSNSFFVSQIGDKRTQKLMNLLPYMIFLNLLHRNVNVSSFVSFVRSFYLCLLCIFLSLYCPAPKTLKTHNKTYHLECSSSEEEQGTRRLDKFYQTHFLHPDICLPPVKSVKDNRTPELSFGCG